MVRKLFLKKMSGNPGDHSARGRDRKSIIKKICAVLLCAWILIALCACGGSSAGSTGSAGSAGSSGGSGSQTDTAGVNKAAGSNDADAADPSDAGQEAGTIIIGSKDFTENEIVAEIYALALEDAGFTVERRMNIASSVIHTSLVSGEVELYPEYTGTGLLSILQMDLITDPNEVYETVRNAYEEQFGITWLDYAPANDGQGIFVSRRVSDEYGIRTISDLQANASEIRFASQGEFDEREDGIPGLEKVYGPFAWKSSRVYDNGLKYQVVENDEADAAPAYTTEGRLVETDKFVLLEDDKQVWPPYNIAPVVRGFGINHSEIFTRKGLSPGVSFPRILGIECVGEIAETTDPLRLPAGQKVISIMGEMGRAFDGGYAEYALLPNEQICPVETDLDWKTLAALPETYYTAYGSLLNLRIGDIKTDSETGIRTPRILVRGATSGVGVAFLRLLKGRWSELHVSGSTRSMKKEAQLREAGFDEVILDADGVLQTDRQFDRVLELIGPATLRDTFSHVVEGGIVCSTGQLGGQWTLNDFDPIFELPANGYLTSFYSGNVDPVRLQSLLDYVRTYGIDPAPERVFSLPQVPEAHAYLESAHSFGKVIVVI